jgi:ribosomal protein L14E/L6E/L27E
VLGKKRGPKVGSGRGKKRKADGEYSENAHTKKARQRKENMSQAQKDLEAAKARERQAISRKIKSLKKTEKYQAMSSDEQKLCESEITAGMKEIQYEPLLTLTLSANI